MKIFPFVLLGGALLLSHPILAQTTPAQPLSPSVPEADARAVGAPTAADAEPTGATRKITVSSLTDKDLKGQNKTDLGDIERVIESKADKRSYVVVSRGGVLGFFGQQYLVPLDRIAVAGDSVVAKELTQAQLEGSTKFVEDTGAYRDLEANQLLTIPEHR
jgi:hypothetical protein